MAKEEISLRKLPVWIQSQLPSASLRSSLLLLGLLAAINPFPYGLLSIYPASGWLYIVLFSCVTSARLFKKSK
jgi:hypothetical protein